MMNTLLTPEEARIIGCLMEKAIVTPDQYPLTTNSLTNACNQKSSREPVTNLQLGEVQNHCRQLKTKNLLRIEENFKNNTEKYTQLFCNTMLGKRQFNAAEYAIICLLLLRGPQTPGELRSRSGRLHTFDTNQDVVVALESLMANADDACVARLARQPGRQDHQYMHLFCDEIDSVAADAEVVSRLPAANSSAQISTLELRVAALEKAFTLLAERLGEEIDLAQITAELNQTDDAESL